MGRYRDSCEQRFRQLFEREFDWLEFNMAVMKMRFSEISRKAIAIDAGYISKAGKKTPYIGKFWSGCASMAKRGLEILGIGIVDIDAHAFRLSFVSVTQNSSPVSPIVKHATCENLTLPSTLLWHLSTSPRWCASGIIRIFPSVC